MNSGDELWRRVYRVCLYEDKFIGAVYMEEIYRGCLYGGEFIGGVYMEASYPAGRVRAYIHGQKLSLARRLFNQSDNSPPYTVYINSA